MFTFLKKEVDTEDEGLQVVRINTHGIAPAELEADKAIVSSKKDNDKRRTVKLERSKLSHSWGFTLQSYGIYNATHRCIENYTYVDYVEMKSPAYIAGMRRSDIIFAVNGQSTEILSHAELIDKIKECKSHMRLVLVNSNICQKVELHQRRQKLQALLRQKQSEIKGLETRETAIQYNIRARLKQKEQRRLKVLADDNQSTELKEKKTSIISENNNIEAVCKSSSSTRDQPHHTTRDQPHHTTRDQPHHTTPDQPHHTTRDQPHHTTPDQRDVRPKLSAYMNKLSLSADDGPTAYERTLLGHGGLARAPGDSSTPRRGRKPNTGYVRSESLRSAKGPRS